MSNVGLVVVEKEYAGEIFSNTYALVNGAFSEEPLTNEDLDAFVGAADIGFTTSNTNPSNPGFMGATSPLAAILAFDRMVTDRQVLYRRLYVSDGKTAGLEAGAFLHRTYAR